MALPNTEQLALDITEWTLPFVCIDATATVNSKSLDIVEWTLPFALNPVTSDSSDSSNVLYLKTGASTWSEVNTIYLKTGTSTWTEVDMYVKDDSGWNV